MLSEEEFNRAMIAQTAFALLTSIIQTSRLKKHINRDNTPQLLILGGGLIAAVLGTIVILVKVHRGLKDIKENNRILRRLNEKRNSPFS